MQSRKLLAAAPAAGLMVASPAHTYTHDDHLRSDAPALPRNCLIRSWLQLSQYDSCQARISRLCLDLLVTNRSCASFSFVCKASVWFSRITLPNRWHWRVSPTSQCSHSACTISRSMLLTTRNATSRSCRCDPISWRVRLRRRAVALLLLSKDDASADVYGASASMKPTTF